MKKRKILNVGCDRETYGTTPLDNFLLRPKVRKVDVDRKSNSSDEVYSKNLPKHLKNPEDKHKIVEKNHSCAT